VIGEFSFVGENAANLVCAWDVSGFFATINDISSNSTTVNNTLVRCNVKPGLTIGQHQVFVCFFSSNNNQLFDIFNTLRMKKDLNSIEFIF
jgi:hypothetical protein